MANLDGKTDGATSQSSERIAFYCDYEEPDTKMFVYIKFLCDNIRLTRDIIVSLDTDAAAISLYQSVTNLTFLDTIRLKTGTGEDQRCISIHVLDSELGLPISYLLSAMHAVSGCNSVSTFSRIGRKQHSKY